MDQLFEWCVKGEKICSEIGRMTVMKMEDSLVLGVAQVSFWIMDRAGPERSESWVRTEDMDQCMFSNYHQQRPDEL